METKTNNSDKRAISAGGKITFKQFASLLEQITKIDETSGSQRAGLVGKNEEKKKLLQKFIEFWRFTTASLKKSDSNVDENFFPAMRFLLPEDDRRIYGLKEVKLAKYLIEALCIGPKSNDAMKLLNYRAPSHVKSDGDFASVAYFVLKNRCQEDNTLTIEEVNHHLDIISVNNAKGKEGQRDVNSSIKHLLVNLSALQLKWLIRIILKDLKIGIKEHIILGAYHDDALDLYNFTSSLEKVCSTLVDPNKRLHEVSVSLFSPCRPMLGEKAKPNKIETLLNGQPFYIETKFDGERFQLHKSDGKYVYFSRNGHDYTETLGGDIYSGSLTPFIHNSFGKDVKNLILDGEMCGYNVKEKILLSLSEEYDVKSNARTWDDLQTCFCVFDILLYNDTVLTNKPLKERVEYIRKSFEEIEGRIVYSTRELCTTNQQVVDALNKAIDTRLEGIVVKDPQSVYKPSVRSGSGWFKVKPDYMLGLNDDLDLIIVGGYYGSGRRSGLLSHFLLAVAVDDPTQPTNNNTNNQRNKVEDEIDELDFEGNNDQQPAEQTQVNHPKLFHSFCKIGSGYSLKELYDFNQKLANKWVPFDKKNPPGHLQVTYERPDVWIEPKDSFIVQVKAVEICPSDKYKAGLTLRFPRLEKFRPDKPWYECMKLSELNELRDKNEGRLTSGKHFDLNDYDEEGNLNMGDDGDDEPSVKKKRMTARSVKKLAVARCFKGIDASVVDKISDLFEGKEFCVQVDEDHGKKTFYEKSIAELGGEICQNPGKDTYCIVASKKTHRINVYINKDLYDIVKVDWLMKCIQERKLIKWKPSDMLHATLKTRNFFSQFYDSYGDSYFDELDVDSCRQLFKSMDAAAVENDKPQVNTPEWLKLRHKIALIENKYFPDESYKFGLFRLCVFYVDTYDRIEHTDESTRLENAKLKSRLDLISLKLRWRGGLVRPTIDDNTTHCILNPDDLTRLNELKLLNRRRANSKFHIVSTNWVNECINASRLVNELSFHL